MRIIVIEPYGGAVGHWMRTGSVALAAFSEAGHDVSVADPPHTCRPRTLSWIVSTTRLVGRTCRRIGFAVSAEDVSRFGQRTLGLAESLRREVPYLLAARRLVRASGPAAVVVITTSYIRPIWLKRLMLPSVSIVEFAFEPIQRPEPLSRVVKPIGLAATTRRIARTANELLPRANVRVIGHFPVSRTSDESAIGDDLRATVDALEAAQTRWGLCFGMLHGKKDTSAVLRTNDLLPTDVAILVAGDPAWEGTHLEPDLVAIVGRNDRVRTVLRVVSEAEREWLFARCDFVVIAQQAGIASMSGSLIDAIAHNKPVVATEDTATGDSVTDLQVGTTYRGGDEVSLASAIRRVAEEDWTSMRRDEAAAKAHGILEPREWALALISAATMSEAEFEGALDSRSAPPA